MYYSGKTIDTSSFSFWFKSSSGNVIVELLSPLLFISSSGNTKVEFSASLFFSIFSGNAIESLGVKSLLNPRLDKIAFKSGKTPIQSDDGLLDFVPVFGLLKIALNSSGVYAFPKCAFAIP